MHLVVNESTYKGKVYKTALLRESYRENGKVKKRTIANLSKCKEEEIEAIKLALKCKGNLAQLIDAYSDIRIKQGLSVGSVFVLYMLAKRLGITGALGNSHEGKLALWQVISRTLGTGSRLASVRKAQEFAVMEVLGLKRGFDENDLYENLKWLSENQAKIEKRLISRRKKREELKLFLYDVTSSYLEGEKNYFGEYGYNRDKKKGKKQIVVGMLCDSEGYPVSVEVFKGNTNDLSTFANQIEKLKEVYGIKDVVFIGDRGMIKKPQIEKLPENFHYITAISKKEIRSLILSGRIRIGLFDEKLCEIREGRVRYILRRNPVREAEMGIKREEKLERLRKEVSKKNKYLSEHRRAKVEVAERDIKKLIKKLKIEKWVRILREGRELHIELDEEELSKAKLLDGCYVLKTDLSEEEYSKEFIHSKYKDLSLVERAFRDCKSTLELRPIYVRREDSTRAHAFVAMLSYILLKYLEEKLSEIDKTVPEVLEGLGMICSQLVEVGDKISYYKVPEPREEYQEILSLLEIKLPEVLLARKHKVVTRKKLKRK